MMWSERILTSSKALIVAAIIVTGCFEKADASSRTCPLTVTADSSGTKISGNFVNFKIEPQWLKAQTPLPLTTEYPWTFAPRKETGSRIGVYFERGDRSSFVGEIFSIQENWYLVVKDRFGWVNATMIHGQLSCGYIDDPEQARLPLPDRIRERIASADLNVPDPAAALAAFGLE